MAMNIKLLACEMTEAVAAFTEKARGFFYSVMLIGYLARRPGDHGDET